jgi:hypothetical protein
MQVNNLFKKEVINMKNIIAFMTGNKVCYLWESIHYNKNIIAPLLCARKFLNKIHRNICPRNRRNMKRHIMWIQTRLSYLTCCASSQEPLYISPHPWPKEVHVQNFLHHLYTKNKRLPEPTGMHRRLALTSTHHSSQFYFMNLPLCTSQTHLQNHHQVHIVL